MGYKFLIITTDYNVFLHWLYARHPGLEAKSYEEQVRVRNESLFGAANFYSNNLRKLGHEAHEIYANNEYIQKRWAKEHGVPLSMLSYIKGVFRKGLQLRPSYTSWLYSILEEQIKHYKPDIVINYGISLSSRFFQEVKPYVRLLVGQHASPLQKGRDLMPYDLMISSLPNLVERFRQQGLKSEFCRLGFEPAVLDQLGEKKETIPVSFVGSLFNCHASRQQWLDIVCQHAGVSVWGHCPDGFQKKSPVSNLYQGPAWGLDMYRVLRTSKITLNHHIDMAESYANNMRLFEATGVGTLLITDWKKNLQEMFEPGKEVVTYKSPEECVELIQYYLRHDDERKAIGLAGQQRALREHTYYQRMKELVALIKKHY